MYSKQEEGVGSDHSRESGAISVMSRLLAPTICCQEGNAISLRASCRNRALVTYPDVISINGTLEGSTRRDGRGNGKGDDLQVEGEIVINRDITLGRSRTLS